MATSPFSFSIYKILQNKCEGGNAKVTGPFSPYKLKSNYTPPFPQGSHILIFVKLVEKDLQTPWERREAKTIQPLLQSERLY